MLGVLTTFYGYKGEMSLLEKVRALVKVFESLHLQPFCQLHSSSEGEVFEELVKELNDLKKEYDIIYSLHQAIWLPFPDLILNLGSSDPEIRGGSLKALKKAIDFARIIGAKNLSFHPGYAANKVTEEKELDPFDPVGSIPRQEALANVEDSLKQLLKYAKKDVKLSIENLNFRPERGYLFSQPEDFERLSEGVGVLFDAGHAYFSQDKIKDLSYVEKMIEAIAGKITEIHACDNSGAEDEHKLPGFGKVPFSEIFKKISQKQELPPIIIEASQKKHNYSEKDLKKGFKFLKNTINHIYG